MLKKGESLSPYTCSLYCSLKTDPFPAFFTGKLKFAFIIDILELTSSVYVTERVYALFLHVIKDTEISWIPTSPLIIWFGCGPHGALPIAVYVKHTHYLAPAERQVWHLPPCPLSTVWPACMLMCTNKTFTPVPTQCSCSLRENRTASYQHYVCLFLERDLCVAPPISKSF